jgi:RimJ/RimL family protein N-acetyltransferase
MIEFESKIGRIVLRKWKAEDAESLTTYANNKKISDNLRDGFPHPYTLKDANEYIQSVMEEDDSRIILAIDLNGESIGSIGAFFQSNIYRKNVEIGYYIGEQFWGKGIMSNAVEALVSYVFDNYDVKRIYAEPFSSNVASQKCLEKAGLKCEAVLKNHVYKNGSFQDTHIYSILRQ